MNRKEFVLDSIPDLSLSKYASLEGGNIDGVIAAHSAFWRQLNRRGLMNKESFHLFYEYDPDRPQGKRLKIGLAVDSPNDRESYICQTIDSSPIKGFFDLKPVGVPIGEGKDKIIYTGPNQNKQYQYSAHLMKKERILDAVDKSAGQFYLVSHWEMSESARLYSMAKLMAAINQPCLYIASIYPRELTREMSQKLQQPMQMLQKMNKSQFDLSSNSVGTKTKDDYAKETLKFYQDFLDDLNENPHFIADIQVLADSPQHARLILDAAASEALEEGSHEQVVYKGPIGYADVNQENFTVCSGDSTPEPLRLMSQIYLLDEIAHLALFPVLYPGEWIEVAKETVPKDDGKGLLLGTDSTGHNVYFPLGNVSKHAFLAGVPGSGKTNAMMHLIDTLHGQYKIPVLIFEPAKHEYRATICTERLSDIELFSPGAFTRFPLHINPFEFPTGMTLAEHIRNLIAVFDGAFSLEPPMPFLLDASVEEVYSDEGWVSSMINVGKLPYPTMSQLYQKLADKIEKTDYGPENKGNLKSALQVRIGSLITREMADIFDVRESTIKPEDWLHRSAIIELESMGKDQANFTTLLIATLIRETLKTVNYVRAEDKRPRHIMFFEEAHNLIGPVSEKVAGQDADPKIAATAYIVKMLAEVRALGEGIIIADQLPTAMAPEIIKNTSLKIGLRITAQEDRELLGGTMNANPDQLEKMSILSTGYALVSYEPLLKPFEVHVPQFMGKEGDQADTVIMRAMLNNPNSPYIKDIKRSIEITFETMLLKLKTYKEVIPNFMAKAREIKKIPHEQVAQAKKARDKLKEDSRSICHICEEIIIHVSSYTAQIFPILTIEKNVKLGYLVKDYTKKIEALANEIIDQFSLIIVGKTGRYETPTYITRLDLINEGKKTLRELEAE